jgi:hypothetical protein
LEPTTPAHGHADRGLERFSQLLQGAAGAGDDHAAAADDHRRPRADQPLRGARDVQGIRRVAHGRETPVLGLGPDIGRVHLLLHHVVRKAQMGRARLAGGHGAEGRAHHAGNLVRAVDGTVPLGQWTVQGFLVQLGQRVLAARAHRHVRGDAKDRNGRFVGLHQPGQQIGRAAAAGAFAHADLAGHAGIGIRHVAGAALVARQDVLHAVVQTVQRVVERQAGVAAQAEYVLDAVVLQHAHHGFGAGHVFHVISTCVARVAAGRLSARPRAVQLSRLMLLLLMKALHRSYSDFT